MLIEEGSIERGGKVVVVRDVLSRALNGVVGARQRKQPFRRFHRTGQPVSVVPGKVGHHKRQHRVEVGVFDNQRPVHIAFPGVQRGVEK